MLTGVVKKLPLESSVDSRAKALTRGWKALPSNLNQISAMKLTYARELIAANAHDDAEKFLRSHIKGNWNPELIALYSTIKTTDTLRHYNLVASWLRKQPQHAGLFLCAARLAMLNKNWQVAVEHFEASIELEPTIEAYRGVSKLLESLGEHERALEMNQKAMDLTEDDAPAIPLPYPLATDETKTEETTAEKSANYSMPGTSKSASI
jgi:uncharacterized protein HemY